MSENVRLSPILAKIEVSYNTDPSPVPASDAILVENPQVADEGTRMNERPAARSSLGQLKHIYGGKLKTITFDAELKGSGTAGTAPEMDVLLRACGLEQTIVPATSVSYSPRTKGHESITIYAYQDGRLHILTGCRGNVSFNGEAGAIGKATFTFTGHSEKPTDIALPDPAFGAIVPAPFINSVGSTIGAFNAAAGLVFAAITYDLQNVLALQPDVSGIDGFAEIQIVSRDVIGTINPEMTLVATKDWADEFRTGAVQNISSGLIGGTAGNQYSLVAPQSSYRELGNADQDGLRVNEIGFGCAETTKDDEFTLSFV